MRIEEKLDAMNLSTSNNPVDMTEWDEAIIYISTEYQSDANTGPIQTSAEAAMNETENNFNAAITYSTTEDITALYTKYSSVDPLAV